MRDHQEIAFRVAFLITRSAVDAEDVTQEAFLKAWAALGRFRLGAPFRPWLLRIVANEARNRVRSERRRRLLRGHGGTEMVADPEAGPPDPAPSPEQRALASDERRRLLTALEGLRDDDRLVISARYLLELSEAEMADVMGIARGTVKSRLSRAMSRLREALGEP
jgi:RNA polymerase sigma-70 factor (ECF subfamily)